MPTRQIVDQFIAAVESGDHVGAIERYYRENASMQENTSPPRVGRAVLMAHEAAILETMTRVETKAIRSVVEGDHVAIHWNFEMQDKKGVVRKVDEVALQIWRGDLIEQERFFYETKPKTVA
jgi:predicted SnoaL-like aldol condensation-catalyzing enzyme